MQMRCTRVELGGHVIHSRRENIMYGYFPTISKGHFIAILDIDKFLGMKIEERLESFCEFERIVIRMYIPHCLLYISLAARTDRIHGTQAEPTLPSRARQRLLASRVATANMHTKPSI